MQRHSRGASGSRKRARNAPNPSRGKGRGGENESERKLTDQIDGFDIYRQRYPPFRPPPDVPLPLSHALTKCLMTVPVELAKQPKRTVKLQRSLPKRTLRELESSGQRIHTQEELRSSEPDLYEHARSVTKLKTMDTSARRALRELRAKCKSISRPHQDKLLAALQREHERRGVRTLDFITEDAETGEKKVRQITMNGGTSATDLSDRRGHGGTGDGGEDGADEDGCEDNAPKEGAVEALVPPKFHKTVPTPSGAAHSHIVHKAICEALQHEGMGQYATEDNEATEELMKRFLRDARFHHTFMERLVFWTSQYWEEKRAFEAQAHSSGQWSSQGAVSASLSFRTTKPKAPRATS